MKRCWAGALGDCSDVITKEHLVSATFWPNDSVSVVGFDWCKSEPKKIGLASLVQHSLCKFHNNSLSDLDTSAGIAIRLLLASVKLSVGRGKITPRGWIPITFNIRDPELLERWFLKTCLNLAVAKPGRAVWRQTGKPLDEVPESLVSMAFGRQTIRRPIGLYSASAVGHQVDFVHGLVFKPLLYGNEPSMVAALFEFGGLRFILHLEDAELPDPLVLDSGAERWRMSEPLYHLRRLLWTVSGQNSHSVAFHWRTR